MAFGFDDALAAGLSIINKFIPDANARQAAADALRLEMQTASDKADSDQRDIDKVEAASTDMFVAGWRPAVGWLCVVTLAYDWMVAPILTWIMAVWHLVVIPLPTLGSTETQALLYALLGLGGLRTVDKLSGNDTKSVAGSIVSSILSPFKKK